jgi:putative membrane protein
MKAVNWIEIPLAGQIFFMNVQKTDQNGPDEDRGAGVTVGRGADRHTSDHLANERTFLAWIRTSIAVIGLGFVVAKFSVWIRELAVRLDQQAPPRHGNLSMPLGIGLMVLGALLALTAAWRYRTVKAAILEGHSAAAEGTIVAVSMVVVVIAVALIAYMVVTG